MNILNILLSNTGEYQDNRPIQRRDGFQDIGRVILPLEDSFVRKLSEGGVFITFVDIFQGLYFGREMKIEIYKINIYSQPITLDSNMMAYFDNILMLMISFMCAPS